MTIETVYLMADNGRFVCLNDFNQVTIRKEQADATCKHQAGWGFGDDTVVLYNTASERYWAVAPDPTTPHVDGLVSTRKKEWTAFNYRFDEKDPTLMTLRTAEGQYVSRVDIGRPDELLAVDGTRADQASQFRVIRFAKDAA